MPTNNFAHISASLSRLPVPDLADTAERFAAVAKPLFSTQEYEACMAKLRHFMANEALVLQDRLHERSTQHVNWLEDWWNEYAYFENRASVCFNVNYFFGFRPTPQPVPQARLAATLIDSALRVRQELESGAFAPDQIRGKHMCMHQYQYQFATCRHPGETRDHTEVYSLAESSHVAIAHKGRFFVLRPPVLGQDRYAAIAQIEAQLQRIIDTAAELERAKSIGILTAALRDDWYAARECLLQVSPENAAALRLLESSAFLVSLESSSPSTHQQFSLECHCSNGVNRYFDKNFQILVFANGRYGFNGEHSLTDATTDMRLCNALVHDVESLATAEFPAAAAESEAEELKFDYNSSLLGHISKAISYFDATVSAHELSTLTFDSFGKEQIKKMKVSPDAFVQMAMQLAYYRKFRQVPPTYESASTKAYARGRTETSRSVSDASAEWCRSMVDHPETTSLHAKSELLRAAIVKQSQYTAMCSKGQGIDRHLLGLQLSLLPGEPVPELFTDPVFTGSRHWKLSTSQISDPILDAYGWGEVVDDGFGVAYRIDGDSLSFNVVSQHLGSQRLCQYLNDALMDMRFLLVNAHKEPHQIMAEVDAVANVLRSIKLASSRTSPIHTPAHAVEHEHHAVDELGRLSSNEVICALETRLSRFVKESLSWAMPSTS